VADYLGLQQRVEKMRDRAQKEALKRVGREIVSLADSLSRALEAAEQTEGAEAITEGLRMIEKEFYTILEELGIRPFKAEGEAFDLHYHEAVLRQPSEEAQPNTVLRELKKGFLLGEELLRPAQVVVAAPREEGQEDQN
jgi:molecular chaperone GrpE